MEGTAYGAGKAGGRFDPISFIKKPSVILRICSLVFAVIVFGCISSQGYYEGKCQFDEDLNACNFGTTVGVLAFLGLIAFLIADALFDNISSIKQRKFIVMGDLGFSGVWTFFWFVCFCYLTNAWRKSTPPPKSTGVSGIEAAIAFSFFSIASFAGLTFLAVQKYRSGARDAFSSAYGGEVPQNVQSPSYPNYPAGSGAQDPIPQNPYQQPFGAPQETPPQNPPMQNFQQPSY